MASSPNEQEFLSVPQEEAGSRLDRYLNRHFPEASFALIAKLLRKGAIRVDQKRAKISDRVKTGQVVKIPRALQPEESAASPQESSYTKAKQLSLTAKERKEISSWILEERDDFLVLNKPAGLAVQGGSKLQRHLDHLLILYYKDQNIQPRLVHRLDKETSGLIIVAKTLPFSIYMTNAFKEKNIRKSYLAILHGRIIGAESGVIDLPLCKKQGPMGEYMAGDRKAGRSAITEYKTLSQSDDTTLIRLKPLTGRTHQLRVHMQEKGTPILGDDKYGRSRGFFKEHNLPKNLCLHAQKLAFSLPAGEDYTITAPLPQHFQVILERFNLNVG